MNALTRELREVLSPGMHVPQEFQLLYEWIDQNASTFEYAGQTSGTLEVSGDDASVCGVEFRADGNAGLEHRLGNDDPDVLRRLCVFAMTGGDGSTAALWLDDEGRQQIVHMGSGSGSTTVCVLAETPLNFLRLLAIGYPELCWADEWDAPPQDEEGTRLDTDSVYRRWIVSRFAVTVPDLATQLVAPAEMDDADSTDPFARWLLTVIG